MRLSALNRTLHDKCKTSSDEGTKAALSLRKLCRAVSGTSRFLASHCKSEYVPAQGSGVGRGEVAILERHCPLKLLRISPDGRKYTGEAIVTAYFFDRHFREQGQRLPGDTVAH